ncbi:MAG: class I SAM-dependent methyltransferase [Methanosarcinales archaeon]
MNNRAIYELFAKEHKIKTIVTKKLKILRKYSKGICLDCACGDGQYIPYFNNCEKVVGIDISTIRLKRAKIKNKDAELILCDVLHLPFKNNTFDFVFASEIIEHFSFDDGQKMLNEVTQVIKNKGIIIITTPNYNNFTSYLSL